MSFLHIHCTCNLLSIFGENFDFIDIFLESSTVPDGVTAYRLFYVNLLCCFKLCQAACKRKVFGGKNKSSFFNNLTNSHHNLTISFKHLISMAYFLEIRSHNVFVYHRIRFNRCKQMLQNCFFQLKTFS